MPSPKTEIAPSIPMTAPIAEVKEIEVVNETPPVVPVRNRLDSVEGTFSDEEEEEKGNTQRWTQNKEEKFVCLTGWFM